MPKYALLLLGCTGLLSAATINVYSIQPATAAGYQQDPYGGVIGPYLLNTSIGDMLVMCMDLPYGVNPPYTGYATPVSDIPTSPLTTYSSNRTIYEEETYLFAQIITAPNLATQGEIQDAAWALTDSAFYNLLLKTNDAQSQASLKFYDQVTDMATGGSLGRALNYSVYDVISNTAGVGSDTQEFIYQDAPPVSEPASISLMGASLLGFGLLLQRASRHKHQAKTAGLKSPAS